MRKEKKMGTMETYPWQERLWWNKEEKKREGCESSKGDKIGKK